VNSPEAYWKLLCDGLDAIREIPEDRWRWQAYYDPSREKAGGIYSRWGGFLSQVDQFDAPFFGISPREAAVMDPQHRLLLEVAWEALEDGGFSLERLAGSSGGVFIGISSHDYGDIQGQSAEPRTKSPYIVLGNTFSVAANRISHALDLRGPSLAVDTACSSSLVAMHQACQSIWAGESALALVGGVNLILRPETYINFCNASMLSPEGHCKSFDARADGYVRAEGAGVIVLKPLSHALRDGDRVYAAVRATAVNQDGHTVGITVPSSEAQAALLREACRQAGVKPAEIQYVEAHGTGTPVGDPLEAAALGAALGTGRSAGNRCWIGSVKSQIGHLEAGAGIAGVIKVALALQHQRIPANLHFQTPNPQIDFERLKLRVPQQLEPWPPGPTNRRLAGVNSFGFGGTNAHVVLSDAPLSEETPKIANALGQAHLVPISARSQEALKELAGAYREWLASSSETAVRDMGYTAAVRRSHHSHRLAVVADNRQQAIDRLDHFLKGDSVSGAVAGRVPSDTPTKLAFVYTGMGPQWWAMGQQLLKEEPVFHDAVAQCDALLRSEAGWSLLEELTAEEARSRVQETWLAQPAIFALQVGLTALWRSWGVKPEAVVGHSVGEVAAAWAAGALTLPEAVQVIFHRSRLQHRTQGQGKMLAVSVPAEQVASLLDKYGGRAVLAAVNSPGAVTLSGDAEALEAVFRDLEPSGVFCRWLKVDVPYHGPHMDPLQPELLSSLAQLTPRNSHQLFSTVTGSEVNGLPLDAAYWWRNVREPVRFDRAMQALLEAGYNTFLEIGPHPVLAASVHDCAAQAAREVTALASLRRQELERATLLETLGKLYVLGYPVEWSRLYADPGRLVKLPPYPWQRERYWREADESRQIRLGLSGPAGGGILGPQAHPLLGRLVQSGQADRLWHVEIDLKQDHGWLADHMVQGTIIYPAAAYAEMAVAAGVQRFGSESCTLEEMECHKPLFLTSEEPKKLQLVLEGGQDRFEIYSQETSGTWTRHATGKVRRGTAVTVPAPVRIEEIRSRCPRQLSREEWYRLSHAAGLEYGLAFQGIKQLWCSPGEALGQIQIPNTLASLNNYHLHPAVLDACIQVLVGCITPPAGMVILGSGLYLPQRIDHLRTFGRLVPESGKAPEPATLWCHVRLLRREQRSITVALQVFDDSGTVLADIRGLTCQILAGTGPDALPALNNCLYEYRWQPQPREAGKLGESCAGCWLIFADHQGAGQQLAADLQQQGEQTYLIQPGETFSEESGSYRIRPLEYADMERLFKEVFAQQTHCKGIVHLWSLDILPTEAATPAGLESAQALGCLNVLNLVRACAGTAWGDRSRLWLVTRGTQSLGGLSSLAVAQAPLWGLGRVIVNEHPELRCTLVDLGIDCPSEMKHLVDELSCTDGEDEIAFRGPDRYVHRLMPVTLEEIRTARKQSDAETLPFRLQIGTPGILDSLTLRPVSRGVLQPGEVEIEVRAAGLNFKDVAKAMGLLGDATLEGTWGGRDLGLECAGVISAVGPEVKDWQVGDEVVALVRGGFSRFVTTDRFVVRMPAGLTFEEAASIPVVFLTAYYALHHLAHLQPGERVLIHAATGGVGLAAVQLARLTGAEVFATAGSPEKRDFLRSLGIQHVMDSRTLDFADQVMEQTGGEGVDVVLNSLTGEGLFRSLELLRSCGRFIELGKRDIEENSRLGLRPFQKHLSFFAIDLDRLPVASSRTCSAVLREVMAQFENRTLQPLPLRVFPISQAADAFHYMARARHIGKIVLSMQGPNAGAVPAVPDTVTFRADATYLVVGGLGGFGLATAGWMVSQGARHLVLMGRSGAATPEAGEAIRFLELAGAQVVVAAADVSCEDQVARVLVEIRASMPPLRGIIHAAMVLDDGILQRLTPARFWTVLAPKVVGAWNLHRLTWNDPLDYFVLFSSVSAVVGNPGQASYAAANLFLDTLAQHRRAQGRPALAVNWTAVADVGYLARNPQVREHFSLLGLAPIPVAQLLKTLGQLLQRGATQTAVMSFKGRGGAQQIPGGTSPRFSCVVAHGEVDQEGGFLSELANGETDPAERRRLLELRIHEHVCKVLGTATGKLDAAQPLASLGFDSLMAVELSTRIKKDLGIEVSTMMFLSGLSTTGLVAEVQKRLVPANRGSAPPSVAALNGKAEPKNEAEIDWEAEMTLDSAIRAAPGLRAPAEIPSVILLTGATGFLGSFLLADLLRQLGGRILCLVRCRDANEGQERIEHSLKSYLLWDDAFASRIVALPGDLDRPLLGLSPETYGRLEEEVDVIYHNGANVNLLEPYLALKPANVLGTREVLALACRRKLKPVHFISSLGTFEARGAHEPCIVQEGDVSRDMGALRFGYTQSKAVAEHLVREAGSRGLPVAVYRPGLINACSTTGAYTTQDFVARLLKSWLELQAVPDLERELLFTPVDYVSQAIVYLSRQGQSFGKTFHLVNPQSVRIRELADMVRSAGYPLGESAYPAWRAELVARARQTQDEALAGMLPFLPESGSAEEALPFWPPPGLTFDCKETLAGLAGSSIACAPVDAHMVGVCLAYFAQIGFIQSQKTERANESVPPSQRRMPTLPTTA